MSSSKKDSRRINLVVPYQAPAPAKDNADVASSMSSVMPMAAMLTRNRFIGWGAVGFSVLSWLGESEEARTNSSTPGYFSVGMSLMALVVTYLPMLLPPPGGNPAATAAAPPAPVPVA
ncbi:hypothetical protein SBRCBS47491_005087 [Sporothrix bragantina]|uniref:Protein Asterix n=1 Tax=Sporothrix bragantina TaxID=671064 RepID=A0ABP0BTT3_9PEZI